MGFLDVTVVMPVKNYGRWLRYSIDTILNQTHRELRLVLVDYGTTEEDALDILDHFKRHPMVRLHRFTGGDLVDARNFGATKVKSRYLAVQDCDDYSSIERVREQVIHLETTDADLVGTWAVTVDADGDTIGKRRNPLTNHGIRSQMRFFSPIIHGSCLMRTEVFNRFRYDPAFKYGHDYALFLAMRQGDVRFSNIGQDLYFKRDQELSIFRRARRLQLAYAHAARLRYLRGSTVHPRTVTEEVMSGSGPHHKAVLRLEQRDQIWSDWGKGMRSRALMSIIRNFPSEPGYWLYFMKTKLLPGGA